MNTGKIIKSKSTERFTTLPNDLIKSNKISLGAKGLLTYLLSLPSDWVIYKQNLYNTLPDKKGTIDRFYIELQESGYIKSIRVHDEHSGRFIGWNHMVYDIPNTEPETNLNRELPNPEKAEFGKNDPIQNKDLIQKTDLIQKKEKSRNTFQKPELSEVIEFFIEKGSSEQTAKQAFEYYEVGNWHDSRGNKIKNWKQKMLSVWINKNINTQKPTDYELRKSHYQSIMQWASTIDGTESH